MSSSPRRWFRRRKAAWFRSITTTRSPAAGSWNRSRSASSGAGATSRHSIGTGVFGGMLAATFLAVFLIPVFYVLVARLGERRAAGRAAVDEADEEEVVP